MSVFRLRKWFTRRSPRPGEGADGETGNWHLGIGGRNSEFHGDNRLLPAARICRGPGSRCCERFLRDPTPLALGTLGCAAWPRILAATSGQTVRRPRQMARQCIALGCCGCGLGNDSISAASRWINCGRVLAVGKVKKKLIALSVVVVAVLLAAMYLWGPGTVPAGQQPLVTLSSENISQFEGAFDADADMPHLVLLLSPT